MGTRALIHIKESDKQSQTLCTIYRQFDGYPEGLGKDILAIIQNKWISNGIQEDAFNGMGCLAAWLIGELKEDIGNVYIYPPDAVDVGEEYTYTVYTSDRQLNFGEVKAIFVDVDIELSEYLAMRK